ncbi:NADH dehydrogenase [ubiquinone] complex I, assembly factor 7 [Neolecta irregularis DAH-3]|uniref:Protein arginine methyltransferase NDUFAF7 n=1 Tax=Neolecta irregularis (strain DAH-3) TaxID=1198029 RepID=A0A1U7LVS9_NEOID|nr:NADH dehydrogenase [ubiquinone] complex I, assembly factor 7 [Neolecta irregularis DAH-3]|eukprot:OLL26744.1 NADH dehydrogenase [ubiquinone] complex I, assembly factor 7 [Neolecta irregularis DAH-3]
MRLCLTNPDHGYYAGGKDPLGTSGDFITSPEISQMFGELIGIWFVTQWMAQKKPSHYNLIELGPGRGTLLDDALRAIQAFPACAQALKRIHLIESSSTLRELQARKLCKVGSLRLGDDNLWRGSGNLGCPVTWHEDLKTLKREESDVPFVIAHEFFDALPIHKFERTCEGWRELLVDSCSKTLHSIPASPSTSTGISASAFQLVRAKGPTPTSIAITNSSPRYQSLPIGSRFECSPDTFAITRDLSQRIKAGGAVLIVDYGPEKTIPIDTLRGIRKHKIVSPFETPGTTDLSADVDFQGIKEVALDEKCDVYGPIEQGVWLQTLGIGARAEQLKASQSTVQGCHRIEIGQKRLVESNHGSMGKAYKFMSILRKDSPIPVGFGGDIQD